MPGRFPQPCDNPNSPACIVTNVNNAHSGRGVISEQNGVFTPGFALTPAEKIQIQGLIDQGYFHKTNDGIGGIGTFVVDTTKAAVIGIGGGLTLGAAAAVGAGAAGLSTAGSFTAGEVAIASDVGTLGATSAGVAAPAAADAGIFGALTAGVGKVVTAIGGAIISIASGKAANRLVNGVPNDNSISPLPRNEFLDTSLGIPASHGSVNGGGGGGGGSDFSPLIIIGIAVFAIAILFSLFKR